MSSIQMRDVKKTYHVGEISIEALAGVRFDIDQGEFAAIVGASGAGKTTVLNILGGMDRCSSGSVSVGGQEITACTARQLTAYRRHDIGFVFQFYNLVQNLTALENIELAVQICREPMEPRQALEEVGLAERAGNFPSQLSGGEQQRVAIARALAKNPKLLLCDEPTGALDCATGKTVLALLKDACRTHGKTVVVVTHNLAIAPMADRVIHIRGGLVSGVQHNDSPAPVESIEW